MNLNYQCYLSLFLDFLIQDNQSTQTYLPTPDQFIEYFVQMIKAYVKSTQFIWHFQFIFVFINFRPFLYKVVS